MSKTIIKTKQVSIEDLWKATPTRDRPFNPESLATLPAVTRRYLERAITPSKPLASAVRLWMHGSIKLGEKWHSFRGEEVICWNRGMIWRATTWMQGLPIWGADRVVDGVGEMQWKILGLFPVMTGSGDDITRSAVGRMQGEVVWLPSVLCDPDNIAWTTVDEARVQANFTTLGQSASLTLTVGEQGTVEQAKLSRWGNPTGGAYHDVDFGVLVQESGIFEGYTIPTHLRAGWFFGSDRFESEGEFFRCTIDQAIYR
ncbi:MAG: DUF6544 family protein [Geitlerinemataceae cyanobacterium]